MNVKFKISSVPVIAIFIGAVLYGIVDQKHSVEKNVFYNFSSGANDTFRIVAVHSLGKVPVSAGTPDTIQVRCFSNVPDTQPKKIIIQVFNYSDYHCDPVIYGDTCIDGVPKDSLNDEFIRNGIFDTTINYKIEETGLKENDLIIVSAIVGDGAIQDANRFSKCYKVTNGKWTHIDSCKGDTAGMGFEGSTGSIVAAFRNRKLPPLVLKSAEVTFIDSVGSPQKPYRIVVYRGDSQGKPSANEWLSNVFQTPIGNGLPQKVNHLLTSVPIVTAGQKFFVGVRQESNSNIQLAFQNEAPVRRNAFFYKKPFTGVTWYDFSDSLINKIPDIGVDYYTFRLSLSALIEGFYNAASNQLTKDTLRLYVRNQNSPYSIFDSTKALLGDQGSAEFYFSYSGNYYLHLNHRNSVETWSSAPVNISTNSSYDFSSSSSQAYGSNQKLLDTSPVKYGIYSGDVNRDGCVDLSDITDVFTDAQNFATGYILTDLTGDDFTDLADLAICFNNAADFVCSITP